MPKKWIHKRVDRYRDLWTKGDKRTGDFILIDKASKNELEFFPNDKYKVSARKNINPSTLSKKHRFYKNRFSALAFVKRYLKRF